MGSNKFQDLIVERAADHVMLIRLNRPEERNAIRNNLLIELVEVLNVAAEDDAIHCLVISGGDNFFAAGADIKEMAELDAIGVLKDKRSQYWERIKRFPKPIIAAVNGYALGGGCELAMHADIIIAGSNAQFGQPEINLGIIPGAGGTQRLIRCIGKSLAMKMVLSGEFIDAKQALSSGLIAEITEPELTINKAIELSKRISQKSPIAVRLAKEMLLNAYETSLEAGLQAERKAFVILSSSIDRQEGINAFLEKRPPNFTGS